MSAIELTVLLGLLYRYYGKVPLSPEVRQALTTLSGEILAELEASHEVMRQVDK